MLQVIQNLPAVNRGPCPCIEGSLKVKNVSETFSPYSLTQQTLRDVHTVYASIR